MSENELATYTDSLILLYTLICIVSLVLIGVLCFAIRKVFLITSLDKYRSGKPGLAELLNSASEVANGVIVLKNGALLSSFMYKGADSASIMNIDRNAIKHRLNLIFSHLDSGWMFHIDAVRTLVPQYFDRSSSAFPDKVSAAIDEERRQFFTKLGNSYGSMFILSVTWMPPSQLVNRIEKFIYTADKEKKNNYQKTLDIVKQFEGKLDILENDLRVVFPDVERLRTVPVEDDNGKVFYRDYLLSWLYFCITGISQPINRPESPIYLDSILAAQDFSATFEPRIGAKWIKVIAIEGLAGTTFPGMLNILSELGCEYRWNTRYIFLDKNEATAQMKKYRKSWAQKQRGFFAQLMNNPNAKVNQDAVDMTMESDDALAEISRGEMAFGFVTQNLILMNENKEQLNIDVKNALQNILSLGLTARVETVNSVNAYFGSLPGHGYENVRRPLISTQNLADLIPLYTPWIGLAENPCNLYPEHSPALMQCVTGADNSTVFRLNLHVRDLAHTLILGPTGAGKSTLLCTLVAQARRYPNMSLFCFDKGKSMYALCLACKGAHYTPGDASGPSFCPLGSIESQSDLAWASNWLQAIMLLNNVQVDPDMVNEINSCLLTMWQSKQSFADTDMSLTSFSVQIQNEEVRSVLKQYLRGQAQGHLIDAANDTMQFSDFMVIEIEELLNLGDKYALPVLLYLFHLIEKRLHGQPAFITLDEAWIMFKNPVFREKIVEWLKVMRKANCGVVMATQELNDAASSGILPTVLSQTATMIFLPNPRSKQEQEYKLYQSCGLNHRQIMMIAEGIPKREYYVVSGKDSRMVSLVLGKFTLAFVGVSDKEEVKLIHDLHESDPENWVDQYLKMRNLTYPEGFEFINL